MFKWFGVLVDRFIIVAFAALFSQFPLFIQQYQQRLSGHVEELQLQIGAIKKIAKQSGKSFDQFVEKFVKSSDLDFSRQGGLMQVMQNRYDNLSNGLRSLQNASVFTKPYLFFHHLDLSVGKGCAKEFSPGLLFNIEGLFYVGFGIVLGVIVCQSFSYFFGCFHNFIGR